MEPPAELISMSGDDQAGLRPRGLSEPEPSPVHQPRSRPAASYAKSQEHLLKQSEHNPLPTEVPPPIAALGGNHGDMHVVVLIGLPDVGKPFLARRMRQYLRFFHGADCELFDIYDYTTSTTTGIFDPNVDRNADRLSRSLGRWMRGAGSASPRTAAAAAEPDDAAAAAATAAALGPEGCQYQGQKVVDSGRCAIIFGTKSDKTFAQKWSGSSKERRRWIASAVALISPAVKLIFVEVKVLELALMRNNTLLKRQSEGHAQTCEEDYRASEAMQRQYSQRYVTIQDDGSEDDMSYVIFINYGQTIVTNRMHGFLRMRIAQFLSTIHTERHTIYLTRHGQSEYNLLGKIGGNSGVTQYGRQFAHNLAAFAESTICKEDGVRPNKARLWTSSLRRTNETAQFIPHPTLALDDGGSWEQMSHRVHRNLDEIFAGEYEGLTYEEIQAQFEGEAFLRKVDKIGYRYPRGESYFDIIARLDPLVHELESFREPTLIVSHQAVLRLLYGYLMGKERIDVPKIEIPLHTVTKLTYDGWAPCVEEHIYLGPDVPKGSVLH